jgi:cytochrome c oxidase subunit 3
MSTAHHGTHPALAHHFDDLGQQREASTLGMWVFLVTEVLFFGGLFWSTRCPVLRRRLRRRQPQLDITLGGISTVIPDRQQPDDGAGGPRHTDR